MAQPSNLFSLSYQGVRAQRPPNVIVKNFNPQSTFSQNVDIGDFWINFNPQSPTQAKLWVLLGLVGGTANWVEIVASAGDILSLTGNSGGAVSPTAGNINILGDTTTINVVGNPGTSTLTISATGDFPAGFVDVINSTASATAPANLNLIKNRAGGPILPGDDIGCLNFQGYDSTNFAVTAGSICVVNPGSSTIGVNRVAGDMEFSTHPDSASGPNATLRMILDHTGILQINKGDNDALPYAPATATLINEGSSILSTSSSTTASQGAATSLLRSRSGGSVLNGDTLGDINFVGVDTNNVSRVGAFITGQVVDTVAPAVVPTTIGFFTMNSSGIIKSRMEIQNTGGVVVSQADNNTFVVPGTATFQVNGSSNISTNNNSDATGALAQLFKTRNNGPVQTNDVLGELAFVGYDSTSAPTVGAQIKSTATGTIAAGHVPSDLEFSTSSTAAGLTERLLITNEGNVTVFQADNDSATLSPTTVSFGVIGNSIISSNLSNPGGAQAGGLAEFLSNRAGGPTQSGDILGTLVFAGYDSGSSPAIGASITVEVTGTVGASQLPSELTIKTTSSTGVVEPRISVTQNGIVVISAPDSANAVLQVQGSVSVLGDAGVGTVNGVDFTNITATSGGGAGAIALQANGVGVTQGGWIKIYINGGVKYIPYYE